MIPTVAMRDFVPAIGAAIAYRPIARNYHVTGPVAGPGAGVGTGAFIGANPARLSKRQNALDHRTMKAVDVLDGGLKHE
jgi:hypothetical protein